MVQTDNINNKILIICGPTASAKTALSIECAKLLDTEIISADSMNIYSGLDIGTAKPTYMERQGIKHHLIDVVNPKDTFTVSDYRQKALPIIDELLNKGKIPVICGGTGFYINSIIYDLSYGDGTGNQEIREKYKKLALEKGNEYVYGILKEIDPDSALKIHFNDVKRVIRALEICANGRKKSEICDDFTPCYNYDAYSIDFPRQELYSRIDKRVDIMMQNGLLDEVKGLIDNGVNKEDQCMQGIGYKEIVSYFENEISLEDAVNLIKINTRHYAKRQITFFKRLKDLKYLTPDEPKLLAKRIIENL